MDEHTPLVVIGSPPCTASRELQAFSRENQMEAYRRTEGVRHMEFVVRLYRKQIEAGQKLIHQNLARATSWALPVIRHMMHEVGVDVVKAAQCMLGS